VDSMYRCTSCVFSVKMRVAWAGTRPAPTKGGISVESGVGWGIELMLSREERRVVYEAVNNGYGHISAACGTGAFTSADFTGQSNSRQL
jgi:hypothetical protein